MIRPDLHRQFGCRYIGGPGSAADPGNIRVPRRTPGPLGVNDAFGPSPEAQLRDFSGKQAERMRQVIRYAVRKLGEAKKELTSDSPSALGRLRMQMYFKLTESDAAWGATRDAIARRYSVMIDALMGHRGLVVDSEQTGPAAGLSELVGRYVKGYVRSTVPPGPGEEGVVYIVSPNFDPASFDDQARALVHEVAHRYAGVGEVRYEHEAGFRKLTSEQALDNADSYAWFAIPKDRSKSSIRAGSVPRPR